MKRLIARYWYGYKRTSVPEDVWVAYVSSYRTNPGVPPEELLALMSVDHIVDFMAEYFGLKASHSYMQHIRKELEADRGTKSLLPKG
jgi:hypothetical protein